MTPTHLRKKLTPFISTLLFFLLWEAVCCDVPDSTFILPKPTESLAALIEKTGPAYGPMRSIRL